MGNNVVYQGNIASHLNPPFQGQVVIDRETGLIQEVTEGQKYKANQTFNKDSLIFAGMGDIHIHAREDETKAQHQKEEYITAGNAALNGGVIHISAMPNTQIPLTTKEHLKWHRDRIKEIAHPVSILNYVGIGNGTSPIGNPGEHPYKAYFGKSVGDLTFYDEHDLEEAIKNYVGHHISFHVEYEPFVEVSSDGKTHSERRPVGVVNHGLKLLLPLIEKYGIDAKLCHWSTGGQSFEMIAEHRERAKKMNLPYTTIEVSPLHLLFDTSMTDADPSLWTKIQMNPAIQNEEHRLALIKGLKNGFIDYLATDHAPHTELEKFAAFQKFQEEFPNMSNVEIANSLREDKPELFKTTCCENGMSGAPWLDVYAPMVVELMKKHNFTSKDIARVTAYNPGNFVNQFLGNQFKNKNFGKGFGKIEKGYVGSLTVINTNKPQIITRDNLQTKVGWSPLEGRKFDGGLEAVVVRGQNITNNFQHY